MPEELTKEEQNKKSLKCSIIDGFFYNLKTGFADNFFSVFAVFLKSTDFQLGMLGSLPLAISSVFQLLSQRLIHLFKSRLRLAYAGSVMQGLTLICLIVSFVLGKLNPWIMVLFIVLYWSFERVTVPAWNSMMGDLVAQNKRGAYFGKRDRIGRLASFAGLIIGGAILSIFEAEPQRQGIGFIIIFSLATISRFLSVYFLGKMHEPEFESRPKPHFTLLQFLSRARHTNFGNFVLYQMAMMLSVWIAAPFFAVYILNDLGLSYWQYTLMGGASVLAKFLFLPLWGHAADKYGTRKIMVLSGFLMPLVPILFVLKSNYWYLILADIYAGFAWAGFDLATFNYIFDSTKPRKRATCVMYNNFLNGVGILAGSLVGAFLVKHINLFWSVYIFVFLLSGILRFIVSLVFVPRIKEIRNVQHITYNKLFFDVLTVKPTMGTMLRIIAFNEAKLKKLVSHTKRRLSKKP